MTTHNKKNDGQHTRRVSKNNKQSPTNRTTRGILEFLRYEGCLAWRENVLPIPLANGGLRKASRAGLPDILGIYPWKWDGFHDGYKGATIAGKPRDGGEFARDAAGVSALQERTGEQGEVFGGNARAQVKGPYLGWFIGIEIKTGKDRLRPEQEGFHEEARGVGACILVVKDFDDFMRQYGSLGLFRHDSLDILNWLKGHV